MSAWEGAGVYESPPGAIHLRTTCGTNGYFCGGAGNPGLDTAMMQNRPQTIILAEPRICDHNQYCQEGELAT